MCKIQSCSKASVFPWRHHKLGKHIAFHQQHQLHQQHWLMLLLPFRKDLPSHKKNQVLNVPSLRKAMKKLPLTPLTLVGTYRWPLESTGLLDNTFFFFNILSMQSKEETKIKVQYKVNTPQHFLPLTSQFRFSMKSREAFGDRHSNMCTDTSTNLPCTSLSAKVLCCLHKKIDSVSAFSFSLPKDGSADQYRLEHQQ